MERPIVLLVEDNPNMREELCRLFGADGSFRIGGVASDGLEAALIAAEIQPDAVLLDVYLPRWDGWRAAEFIRRHSPRTKIIAWASGGDAVWADCTTSKAQISSVVGFVESVLHAA